MVRVHPMQNTVMFATKATTTNQGREPETNWERISNRFKQSKNAANILLACERKVEAKEVITIEIQALLKDLEEASKESDIEWIAWAILEFTRWRGSNMVFPIYHALKTKFANGIPPQMAHCLARIFKRQANFMNGKVTHMRARAKQLETT